MRIFITLDYELFFGQNHGSLERCMIEPTEALVRLGDKYGAKFTFFTDCGYLCKLKELESQHIELADTRKSLLHQIERLSNAGHDFQLHIHPHWEDTDYDASNRSWKMDTTRFRLGQFSAKQVKEITGRYKACLEEASGKSVFTYRAGGWSMQPFEDIGAAFKEHGIWLDSTVFPGGYQGDGAQYFDFRDAPFQDEWKFEEDPAIPNESGFFTEVPIASYNVPPTFFWKLAYTKKLGGDQHNSFGDGAPVAMAGSTLLDKLTKSSVSVVAIDGYKASFLEDAYNQWRKKNRNNFVVIGHPKAFTRYSLKKLEEFLKKHRQDQFTTFTAAYA